MILVSYTNARGETVVLDDTERTFLGELYGREGVEAPALEYVEITYADGSTEILAVNIKPRDVTLYFWVPTRQPHHRVMLEAIKQKLIQSGIKSGDWGKLMIRRPDGHALYLDCVYTGGFDEFVREWPNLGKFSLTFHAEDPLFHDDFETVYVFEDLGDMLYFEPEPKLYFREGDLFMRSGSATTENVIQIDGEKVYPKITITGPAANIGIINVTTGKQIVLSIDVVLGSGDTITIVTEKLKSRSITMKQNGVTTNLLNKLTAASSLNFWLARGQNRIQFTNASVGAQSSLQFVYKEGYLSAE